jgi:glutathione S-transferase
MKLYYAPGACSLSPHIVLRETNTPFTLVKVDLAAKTAEDGSDFFAINPNGYVPALQLDDGTILTEGPAIVQYIADQAGATALAPRNGTLERYKLQSWLNFISAELH